MKTPDRGIVICPDAKCRAKNGNWRTRCKKCRRKLTPTARSVVNEPKYQG